MPILVMWVSRNCVTVYGFWLFVQLVKQKVTLAFEKNEKCKEARMLGLITPTASLFNTDGDPKELLFTLPHHSIMTRGKFQSITHPCVVARRACISPKFHMALAPSRI
ncbi:hypothetical protein RHMOL_Rhmol03G0225700 [Rhododendron molle]|uniref:Uncharacterized protein n=1 Tax=Rhododendron molle TaxID=49168 RepID=A0ACC0PH20_RHOML|nr:hypothetical protein RHMOL_Rhmol03G0225700 [Rhododendron molle]